MEIKTRPPLSITARLKAELRVRVCRDGRRAVFDVKNGETQTKKRVRNFRE